MKTKVLCWSLLTFVVCMQKALHIHTINTAIIKTILNVYELNMGT